MSIPGRRWLTVAEVSDLYSLHRKTILALCRARRIPHARFPSVSGGHGKILIDLSGLEAILEQSLVLPAEPAPLDRRRRT